MISCILTELGNLFSCGLPVHSDNTVLEVWPLEVWKIFGKPEAVVGHKVESA